MRAPGRPRLRRLVVAAASGAAAIVATAAPAAAHTVGGVDATNYATTIRSVSPADPDVTVRVADNGDRLELTNTGRTDVVVVGYDDEAYLRVGPRGVFENVRSPAVFLNRVRRDPEPPPPSADPEAPPRWRKVSDGQTARWHDHRAHWMGAQDPPIVARRPGEEHLVQRFRIDVRADGGTIRVRGDVRWVPGPSPWPWIAGGAALAIATVVGARTRRAPAVLGTVLVVALVAATVHAVGAWTYATAAIGKRAGDAVPTIGAIALGVVALVQLARRGLRTAAPLLVFAGLFVAIAIGLADMSALSKSQLPTDLSPALDRLTVALALGGGFGVAGGAALHVADRGSHPRPGARHPSPDAPTPAGGPPEGAPTPSDEARPVGENDSHSMMQG